MRAGTWRRETGALLYFGTWGRDPLFPELELMCCIVRAFVHIVTHWPKSATPNSRSLPFAGSSRPLLSVTPSILCCNTVIRQHIVAAAARLWLSRETDIYINHKPDLYLQDISCRIYLHQCPNSALIRIQHVLIVDTVTHPPRTFTVELLSLAPALPIHTSSSASHLGTIFSLPSISPRI